MKFFLQDDTSVKVEQILSRITKLMDGDVSHQMRQKGLDYKKNYGASVFWLRKLAAEYPDDNKLADRLWNREIRETMVLATMIAVPDDQLQMKLEDWAMVKEFNEIAEQLGVNLLYRFANISQWAAEWLTSTSEWKQAAMWVGLATYLQKGGNLETNQVNSFIKLLKENNETPERFMMRVQGRFLRQLCRKSNEYLIIVETLIAQFRLSKNLAWLVEDVQTEIDFLKE